VLSLALITFAPKLCGKRDRWFHAAAATFCYCPERLGKARPPAEPPRAVNPKAQKRPSSHRAVRRAGVSAPEGSLKLAGLHSNRSDG
jgi:hypothetical protein